MARKSRKVMPAVSGAAVEKTVEEVIDVKPYQVGVYARLSHESEANKERDTVETQIAYIRNFVAEQTDMVVADVYADISVTGTTFERPEFERMIQDIRQGKINTVITRDLSRLGRNYVEMGNYIERVFPFLDVRYIAITDDFDTARPGTDLSVPLKNIVNEYYSKDLSKKIVTGKRAIWSQGGYSEGVPPYGYVRGEDGSRKLVIDEEVSENVKRIFALFLEGVNYTDIAKLLRTEGIPSPLKYYYAKRGNMEKVAKVKDWDYSHVSRILSSEYYIGNSVHGKQVKCLATGEKNRITDRSEWIRVEGTHEPIIDKETFEKVQEKIKELSARHPKKLAVKDPNYIPPPENKFSGKIFCGDCGARMRVRRQYHTDDFGYYCSDRRKKLGNCGNGKDILIEDVETAVFNVIKQHMTVCIDKIALVGRLNSRKENVMQYDVYAKEIAKLRREVQRISNNKGGLYEDYRDKLITAEELCQYQNEYEERIKEISGQIDILLIRQRAYEKDFHINEDWEETVNKYLKRRKLTKEMADVFVSKVICHPGGNIEVHLVYDDFMEELLKISEEREAENGR